jgi:predicted ATPase
MRDAEASRSATYLADLLHELRVTHQVLANDLGVTRHTVDSWTRIANPAIPAGDNLDRLCLWLEQRKPGAGKQLATVLATRSNTGSIAAIGRQGLHVPESRLIGREQDLLTIRGLVNSARLVTLTGPGGVGKTRLALQTTSDCLPDYRHGAHVIELATLANPQLLESTIAAMLGVYGPTAKSIDDQLLKWLTSRQMLLVLDNCEHLLAELRALTQRFLNASPGLSILTTSREALGLPDELVWRVPPLAIPADANRQSVVRAPACRLFVERALFSSRSFAITDETAPVVADICRRLDGIPLAIELAASALQTMPVDTLAKRLDDRFKLLGAGRPDAFPHHRTLRATIEWSYNLLSPNQQSLLQQLSVFQGAWDADAALAVAEGAAMQDNIGVVAQLIELVRKSLIVQEETQNGMRYRMLESIREYARERLQSDPKQAAAVRQRHAAHFFGLAERAERGLQGKTQLEWLRRLSADLDNLRAAVVWGRQHKPESALMLIGNLWLFWRLRNHLAEARTIADETLSLVSDAPSPARAKALMAAGVMAYYQGDHGASRNYLLAARGVAASHQDAAGMALIDLRIARIDMYHDRFDDAIALTQASLSVLEREEEDWLIGYAYLTLGEAYNRMSDNTRMQAAYQRAFDVMDALGDTWGKGSALNGLGGVALHDLNYAQAMESYEQSLAMHRQLGDLGEASKVINNLGECARGLGDFERAEALYRESLRIRLDIGALFGTRMLKHNLSRALIGKGDMVGAADVLRELLDSVQGTEDGHSVGTYLHAVATLLVAADRNHADAAQLFGSALHTINAYSEGIDEPDRSHSEAILLTLRERLGEAAFAQAWSTGETMGIREALALGRRLMQSHS